MKKLQTMKSLSLMSTKPMGLFQLKKGGTLSFSEMILKRTNPIFLSIKNDTVRFFLKQLKLEKSVVHHHHLHKQEIENSYITNHNNFKSEKNLKVRDILYVQKENLKENNNTFISEGFNLTNNTYNKVKTVDETKVSTSKLHKKPNHSFSTIKQQNSLESTYLHPNITKLKSSFPSFTRYLLNSEKDKNTITLNVEENLKQENILNFYQYEHKKMLQKNINSINNFTFHKSKNLKHSFPKHKTDNAFTSVYEQYKQIDKNNTTNMHNAFEKEEMINNHNTIHKTQSSKNYHNYKNTVEISYKKEPIKKEEIAKSTMSSSKQIESQESHMLNSPLLIKNGIEVINNHSEEENTTIINNIEEKLIQTVSYKVMEKIESMWSREIMRRGGDYGR